MGSHSKGAKMDAAQLNALVADVVAAYVSNNRLAAADLPGIIGVVHEALSSAGVAKAEGSSQRRPHIPIGKTITPDYLVSLEDGQRYQTLGRHLSSRGLTPEAYRTRWGLPPDYPMIAENYRQRRSVLAKSIGLGHMRTPTTKAGSGRKAG